MLFSSPIFMFLFLPSLLLLYFLSQKQYRNLILLAFSLVFYAWGEPQYVIVMLLSISMNYLFALVIDSELFKKHSKWRPYIIALCVLANLSLLLYFKYTNFFIENINFVLSFRGRGHLSSLDIIMPIGISFFTFQSLSYVIDVYRGKVQVQKSFLNLALYVSFFPQLIAGPIVRYIDVDKEINERHESFPLFVEGVRRFIIGFGKKILIANTVAKIADQIFELDITYLSTSEAWIGILCYTIQIYYDFSGYSDMAIGLGKVFGFNFLENFNYPYISRSITEFWRRWHISLSTWFRDYVYIPLGGNRKGVARTYLNSLLVFFITGFWHGASWNFVLWGMFHGAFLVIEKTKIIDKFLRLTCLDKKKNILSVISHFFTMLIIMIGWVFFRADTLGAANAYLLRMFCFTVPQHILFSSTYYLNSFTLLAIGSAVFFAMPIYPKLLLKYNGPSHARNTAVFLLRDLLLVVVLVCCVMNLASSAYNPFIYFRF